MQEKKLAVLVSGIGTNLAAILDSEIEVGVVIADRQCPALSIAEKRRQGRTILQPRSLYRLEAGEFDRVRFTMDLMRILKDANIDIVMMAGFLTVLDGAIFDSYPFAILNTHASLLPAFKGKDSAKQAWDYGVRVSGCTLHYATAELDGGPIIDQRVVLRHDGDTFEQFHERIKAAERQMVVENLRQFLKVT